jgi:hypothetical protein
MPEHGLRRHLAGAREGRGVLWLGFAVGIISFIYYYSHGLTTAHYDAKAHLVVARRILDSTSPGYTQMGAHWLPLIHLLYLPAVFWDGQYHSGVIPSLISVSAFAVSGWMTFRIAQRMTGSAFSGFFAAAVVLGNPNLLYLQSAPLTEPVSMALSLLALDSMLRWRDAGAGGIPWQSASWAALGALCRYEGWLFVAGLIVLVLVDSLWQRIPRMHAFRAAAAFAGLSAIPLVAHFSYIYLRLGDSFFHRVARGSPAPSATFGRPLLSIWYHFGEVAQAAGTIPLLLGLAGTAYCLVGRERRKTCAACLVLWLPSLLNIAALHWGLIYRVRYSVLLLPAIAVFGCLAAAQEKMRRQVLLLVCFAIFMLPWISWASPATWNYHLIRPGIGILFLPITALVLLLATVSAGRYHQGLLLLVLCSMWIPVFQGEYRPMVAEALEHRYMQPENQAILDYLKGNYQGGGILIDLGRQAPLMYDSGLPLENFVCHEGDGSDWYQAVADPIRHVAWLFASEGDEVWGLLQVDPHWADGYSLAVQTDHYGLYQRKPESGSLRPDAGRNQ